MGATKTYAIAKRFYYWPGMFVWICALTADCLTCQNNKPKPKHLNEVPLEEWQKEAVPFRTVHNDHKGPLQPTSASNAHCLIIIDSFSRFLMLYPVRNTMSWQLFQLFKSGSFSLESHNPSSTIEVLLLSIQSSSTGLRSLGLHCDLVQLIRPGQMAKSKPRTSILLDTGEILLMMPEITGLD